MKICKFFFLVLVLLCPQLSWGGCMEKSCSYQKKFFTGRVASVSLVEGDESTCYFCGKEDGMCKDGDVVPQKDANDNIVNLFQCDENPWGRSNTFNTFVPGSWCERSPIKPEGIRPINLVGEDNANVRDSKGIYLIFKTTDASATTGTVVGDITSYSGQSYCAYVDCKAGYIRRAGKECVLFEDVLFIKNCKDSHGIPDISEERNHCECDFANKNLRNSVENSGICECIDDHTWNDGEQKCVHNDKNDCDTTGGSWDDTNKKCECKARYTTKSGTKCVCESSDYGWKDSKNKKQGCSLKDSAKQKQACENARSNGQDVEWDGSSCKCVNDTEKKLKFEDGKCVEKSEYTQCKKLGAQAEWDDINGKCKCLDSNMDFFDGECKHTEEYLSELEKSKKAAEKKTAEEHIKDFATKNLDSVVANFDRSEWRDIDGNFNTARLASDSVAAVVLGTAGGLISSKVIKKKQVENGFEDIKCTIGNQEVADWGDEFQVGIQ